LGMAWAFRRPSTDCCGCQSGCCSGSYFQEPRLCLHLEIGRHGRFRVGCCSHLCCFLGSLTEFLACCWHYCCIEHEGHGCHCAAGHCSVRRLSCCCAHRPDAAGCCSHTIADSEGTATAGLGLSDYAAFLATGCNRPSAGGTATVGSGSLLGNSFATD
jgi:hypothetical protein